MERRERLGRAIRRARLWRSLSQAQLGAAVGVTERTVGRWERGEVAPSLLVLAGLCTALSVPADYFRRAPDEDVDRLLLE